MHSTYLVYCILCVFSSLTERITNMRIKKLLTHSGIKGSERANCIALDNTSILNVSSSSITKTQTGENLTVSNDYMPSNMCYLTTYQHDCGRIYCWFYC